MNNEILRAKDPDDPKCVDFILNDGADYCWVTIGNIAIYLHKTDEGVAVYLYPDGHEEIDEIASTYALFQDADNAIDEWGGQLEEYEMEMRNA